MHLEEGHNRRHWLGDQNYENPDPQRPMASGFPFAATLRDILYYMSQGRTRARVVAVFTSIGIVARSNLVFTDC